MDVTTILRRLQMHLTHDDDEEALAQIIADALAVLGETESRAVIRHAYWWLPGVPTATLRRVVGSDARLRRMAGRGPVIGACRECGRVMRARGRDVLDAEVPARCAECRSHSPDHAPAGGAGFGWEFEVTPLPWQPADGLPAGVGLTRDWAEHYPAPDTR